MNISCNPLMRDPEFITFAQFRDAKKKKEKERAEMWKLASLDQAFNCSWEKNRHVK